jgi:hypothetical protein|tara:strand:+ start:5635 stop:5814 length:180 start_codon:yes stop_codon:yes gene_type:complete
MSRDKLVEKMARVIISLGEAGVDGEVCAEAMECGFGLDLCVAFVLRAAAIADVEVVIDR